VPKFAPRQDAVAKLALVVLNLAALHALVAPVRARLDLTEQREYTISDTTREVLRRLPDQVELHGFFSEETHPKLKALIPLVRDVLEEYRVLGEGKVVARMVDPRTDELAEKEAYRRFDVRATPFRLETQFERGVKSAYFAVVVAFGDHYVKLGVEDLIDVARGPNEEPVVRLRGLEYQLTTAIDKVVREFGTLELKLAELSDPVRLEVLLTEPERAPEGEVRDLVAKKRALLQGVVDELVKKYRAGFAATFTDPSASPAEAERVRASYRAAPIRVSPGSSATIWLDAVVFRGQTGERVSVRDLPDRERTAGEIREAVEAGIRRLLPGAMKTIGIASQKPKLSPDEMIKYYQMGMEPPGDEYGRLRAGLKKGFQLVDVDLSSGKPPLDCDVLLVMKPKDWTEKHELALDQYLMYGGKAIVCLDHAEFPQNARSFALEPVNGTAADLLARYGVTVKKELVLDKRNVPYPLPVWRDLGGLRVQMVEQVPYPWFLDLRGESIDRENPVVSAVEAAQLLWASPIAVDESRTAGLRVSRILTSSEEAWTSTDLRNIEPKRAYDPPSTLGRHVVGLTLEGRLTSAFKDRPQAGTAVAAVEPALESPPTTRLVVIGDADFASDLAAGVAASFKGNEQLVANLVDWALLDEALIRIRSRGTAERPLKSLDASEKKWIQAANYVIPIGLVVLVGFVRGVTRRLATRRGRPASRGAAGGGPPGGGGAAGGAAPVAAAAGAGAGARAEPKGGEEARS
jgi:ABC-2 type transport system permease protein